MLRVESRCEAASIAFCLEERRPRSSVSRAIMPLRHFLEGIRPCWVESPGSFGPPRATAEGERASFNNVAARAGVARPGVGAKYE